MYKQRNNKKSKQQSPRTEMSRKTSSYLNCLKEFKVAADGKKLGAKTLLSTRNESLNKKIDKVFEKRFLSDSYYGESVPSGWKGNHLDQEYDRAASTSSIVSDIWERNNNAQYTIYPQLSKRDSEELQFVSPFTKRSPFKKVTAIASGSSASSVTSSIVSVIEEIQEISEENVSDYRTDSFEEVTSDEIISFESSEQQESSRRSAKISSTETKSINIENKNDTSNSSSSEQLLETTESESITTSKISSEMSFSSNRTTKSRTSWNCEAKSHGEGKELELSRKGHRNIDNKLNVEFNRTNSGSNRKCELESRCHVDDRAFYGYSNNRSRSINADSPTDKKLKQSDIFWLPTLKDTDKGWKKTKDNEKRYVKDAAVQTVRSQPESVEPLPMFTPLLLRTITENIGGKNELETVSRVIRTHVELIKRQAWREKRILEEWDSIISDFEGRCQFVNFQRLKFILHGNNYCFTC